MKQMKKILAKLLFCSEDSLDTVLLHMPVGVFNVFLLQLLSGWLGLAFCLVFITYEKTERKVISDKCYPDLQGWLWGAGITAVVWMIIK